MSQGDSPYTDPPLSLTVAGLRWTGSEFERFDSPVEITLHGTDSDEEAVQVLRSLRKIAARRLWMALAASVVGRDALDFDAPNAPTEANLKELIGHIERALAAARVLAQLAPEIVSDEDED